VYSLATNRMIETVGLGWALRVLGIVSLILALGGIKTLTEGGNAY